MLAFDTCALALCLTRTARLYLRNGISALTFVLLRDQVSVLVHANSFRISSDGLRRDSLLCTYVCGGAGEPGE